MAKAKYRFNSVRYAPYNMHNDELLQTLGLGNRLPDEGMLPREVQGITVWVDPITRIPGRKLSKHRVKCACPGCGKVMSAGRLFQHICEVES